MLRNPSQRVRMVRAAAAVTTVGLLCLSQTAFASSAAGHPSAGAGVVRFAPAKLAIKDSYIVVYKNGKSKVSTKTSDRMSARYGARIGHRYSDVLNGFAGTMTAAQATKIAADPSVAYVEQNQTVTIAATQTPVTSWGLDRVDQAALPLNKAYTYPRTGAGVKVYVLDTGIRTTNKDLGGRVTVGPNIISGTAADGNGHGTHVAGIIGGATYGVAKGVQLVSVKVVSDAGSTSTAAVITGLTWVAKDHAANKLPAVANLSLGTAKSAALDSAISKTIAAGVTVVAAAGNDNSNACNYSPGDVPAAITVAASDIRDTKATFSNFGSCVDLYAAGVAVTSDWNTSDTATNTITGTSVSAPFVAGAAALILQATPTATPAMVASKLIAAATLNAVKNNPLATANRLLRIS